MKKRDRLAAALLSLSLLAATPAARAYTVYGYSEGMAQVEEDGKWGFAGSGGEVVVPIQYRSVVSFSLGMAAVNLDGKLGVIRPDGEYLIEPEYDTLMPAGYGLYMAQRGRLGRGEYPALHQWGGGGNQRGLPHQLCQRGAGDQRRVGRPYFDLQRRWANGGAPFPDSRCAR